MNEIVFTKVAQDNGSERKGMSEVAKLVANTFGPLGGNIFIQSRHNGAPLVTKDGVSVARSLSIKDQVKRLGAELIKSAGENTLRRCGDGTSSTILLTDLIVKTVIEDRELMKLPGNKLRKD